MSDASRPLDHLYVTDRAANENLTRGGQGNPKIRPVEHRAHGLAIRGELESAFSAVDEVRLAAAMDASELEALGTIIVLEGADAAYPLKVESLDHFSAHRRTPKRPMWLLLSVQPATQTEPERATVWVSDDYRDKFLKLFEDYLTKVSTRGAQDRWTTPDGNPANQALIANIARIRQAVLRDLWTSEGDPPERGSHWWELWLSNSVESAEAFDAFVSTHELRVVHRSLALRDRLVVWVHARWDLLQVLPFTKVLVGEVRRPEFVETIEDLPTEGQDEYVEDLAARVVAAPLDAPAVAHLDTGVLRGHVLLRDSLSSSDMHTVIGTDASDVQGHGTSMAGLALYGDLGGLLESTDSVRLAHRLESVRLVPGTSEPETDPLDFGTVTADAISLTEIAASRPRVFCLPLSTSPDRPGEPTLWSSTIDALAVGTPVVRDGDQLQLMAAPEPEASRLIIVAAGNVDSYHSDHRLESDTSPIEDPAQSWNALTVSAFTNLAAAPTHPDYQGWRPMANAGELSPHSRTSRLYSGRKWPIKPDICMEGGNVLTDGGAGFEDRHPLLSLRSTGHSSDLALTSANATSAASAQAARLAAIAMSRYPAYWPETVRGLLTHSAHWTSPMKSEIEAESGKTARQSLLRRYGWGVPTEDSVLNSSGQAVTMVTQDEFVPFAGSSYSMRHFRLHSLPWPRAALEDLGEEDVTLRITLSYFIEPSASRRGWRQRYSYASHGLRFDVQGPLESQRDFVRRVNRDAGLDEEGGSRSGSTTDRWLVGPNQRNLGSLHQDEWTGTGLELAASGSIAIYPVGGWWKNNGRADRRSRDVRYALIVSLRTRSSDIDLYTPIANEIGLPTAILV
ncbi:S8 family peptidase [Leifsonia sp. LS-T14]|uniref:S8 family peptidase n=1 Tax=unclassified Leifsonia TaxID=2663824 RepID=UPI0035A6BD1C